jgi:hypothetical protein
MEEEEALHKAGTRLCFSFGLRLLVRFSYLFVYFCFCVVFLKLLLPIFLLSCLTLQALQREALDQKARFEREEAQVEEKKAELLAHQRAMEKEARGTECFAISVFFLLFFVFHFSLR